MKNTWLRERGASVLKWCAEAHSTKTVSAESRADLLREPIPEESRVLDGSASFFFFCAPCDRAMVRSVHISTVPQLQHKNPENVLINLINHLVRAASDSVVPWLTLVRLAARWTRVITQSTDVRLQLLLNVLWEFSELSRCFAGEN